MKINIKLISSFGTVLITTLSVFGMICYYTIAENTRQNSDRIITLQSNEIIYQATKTFNKQVKEFEQRLSSFTQSNTCSLNSEAETKELFTKFASQTPPFLSIRLYHFRGDAMPPEVQTWRDEIDTINSNEPFLRRHSDDLLLLWPTQTPKGRAFFVITIDQTKLAALLRYSLRINGAAIMLAYNGQLLASPIQQDQSHPLPRDLLDKISTIAPTNHI